MRKRGLACVSVDLDAIGCYYHIHGMAQPGNVAFDIVLRNCLPRFIDLFAELNVQATFFVVARDVDIAQSPQCHAGRAAVAAAAAAGHEIASHSYSHPYQLSRMKLGDIAHELEAAQKVLRDVAGRRIEGFRAPGYDLSPNMLAELARLGYTYDSSVFPAPGYYAAKAAIMAGMRLLGLRSGAVLTHPALLQAPRMPYRPNIDAPWRSGAASVVELPIAVTPGLRIPVIGTSLLMAPIRMRRRMCRALQGDPFFNLELHGIDLADAERDGLPGALIDKQPDLRIPFARKRQVLADVISEMASCFRYMPMRAAAVEFQREL